MTHRWIALLVAGAFSLVASTPTTLESSRWWYSPRWTAALKLSREQTAAIDDIYWRMLPDRMALATRAQGATSRVARLLPSEIDESQFVAAIGEATDAEAARRRLRTLMLYRIARVLTPMQRDRCSVLRDADPRPDAAP